MGILNVTPDSFSDGGQFAAPAAAIAHGRDLAAQGAHLVDVGGESTRPGATRITAEDEMARVLPVVEALAADGIAVSVDTMRAEVAAEAVRAGATLVNDVSGGLADPQMLAVVADLGCDYVAMHWRAHSATMQDEARYDDVVAEVTAELVARRDAALAAGIDADRLVLDPGIGFSKTWDQNWTLLTHLDVVTALGHRVLVGASRKRFLGEALGGRDPVGRDAATAAISAWCGLHGVWAVRTHEVVSQLDAIAVAERLRRP